jgi:hypothetical protein
MAELTISADEIRSAIQNYVTEYSPDVSGKRSGSSPRPATASPASRACPRS